MELRAPVITHGAVIQQGPIIHPYSNFLPGEIQNVLSNSR